MKKAILILLTIVAISLKINAQIINDPECAARSRQAESIAINQIELTEQATVISLTLHQSKGTTFSIPSETYIVPSTGGEKLFVQTAKGVEINKTLKMPRGGKLSFKLYFPRINKNVKKIDYREGNKEGNWHFFEINVDPDYTPRHGSLYPDKGVTTKDGKQIKYIINPQYVAKSDDHFRISRVELLDTATVLYFEITGMFGGWVYIPSESCIQSSDGGRILYVKSAEGTSINEKIWLKNTDEMSYKLYFPKLDENVKKINFKELNGGNWSVFELDVSMDTK